MALIVFHIQDPDGRPLGGATLDARSKTQGDWSGTANPCGDFFADLGPGHYDITVKAAGYQPRTIAADLGDPGIVTIGLDRATTPAAGLAVRGAFFTTAAGDPYTIIECTDFQAFQSYLTGEDVVPVLAERAALGFNTVRVFLMCSYLFPLNPLDVPGYYDRLSDFTTLLLDQIGLTPEYVAFADATRVMPNPRTQVLYWDTLTSMLAGFGHRVLLELVNENDQPINALTLGGFSRPSRVLASHGSNGSERWPPSPPWTYATFHTNDAIQWWRKVGHNAMEVADAQQVPCLANENTRAPDRFTSPRQAYDAAAGAALLCAGSCFHSVSGRASRRFDEVEAPLAVAWVAGARSVNLKYQHGAYRHRQDLEGSEYLRVYSRVLPDGDEGVVMIRK